MAPRTTFLIPQMQKQNSPVLKYDEMASWKNAVVCFNILNFAYDAAHSHDYYEVCIVFSGSMIHNINGQPHIMRRGDCCLIRPDDFHFFEDDPGQPKKNCLNANFLCRRDFMETCLRTFAPDCSSMLREQRQPLNFKVSNSVVSKLEKTCLYIQSPGECPTDINLMICKSIIMELVSACVLTQCTQSHSEFPEWLNELILSMQDPDNFSKNVPELIRDISYSYSYIQKQFRHYMGSTIIAYWSSIKLSHARELLSNTNLTVLEISTRLGFETASHFNHLFKKHYGISPSAFRK